jgi:hypothetical protein
VSYLLAQADAVRLPLADRAVNLTVGSPPYMNARTYDDGTLPPGHVVSRDCAEWVEWMLRVTAECLRVTDGPVVWVVGGVTRDRTYWPGCEGLAWKWWAEGWGERGKGTHDEGSAYRPCYWHRYGIPGSGGDDWFRGDVEYLLCFKRPGKLPWSDNTADGEAPKFGPGGALSHRLINGGRKMHVLGRGRGGRRRNGGGKGAEDWANKTGYSVPEVANPGNFLGTGAAGGGNIGHALAHENEAPYPPEVPERFIKSLCPIGGLVLDPFSGSGTTVETALRLDRRAIGLDLRPSQARIARQRLDRPHAPVPRSSPRSAAPLPLFDD